jgi:hypothetical protein
MMNETESTSASEEDSLRAKTTTSPPIDDSNQDRKVTTLNIFEILKHQLIINSIIRTRVLTKRVTKTTATTSRLNRNERRDENKTMRNTVTICWKKTMRITV